MLFRDISHNAEYSVQLQFINEKHVELPISLPLDNLDCKVIAVQAIHFLHLKGFLVHCEPAQHMDSDSDQKMKHRPFHIFSFGSFFNTLYEDS